MTCIKQVYLRVCLGCGGGGACPAAVSFGGRYLQVNDPEELGCQHAGGPYHCWTTYSLTLGRAKGFQGIRGLHGSCHGSW
jgi:hypothetical protein